MAAIVKVRRDDLLADVMMALEDGSHCPYYLSPREWARITHPPQYFLIDRLQWDNREELELGEEIWADFDG